MRKPVQRAEFSEQCLAAHDVPPAPQRGVYHNRGSGPRRRPQWGDCAAAAPIGGLRHIMLPHFHGSSASARGGKASPSSICPCEFALGDSPPGAFILATQPTLFAADHV